MELSNQKFMLEIRDEGRGIPPHILQGFHDRRVFSGVGLPGMRERVSNLGGTLNITSDNSGTTVVVNLLISDVDQSLAS
jgi:signal transduction histidine kinase